MAAADKFILDRLTLRETQLHQTNDALDVKASVLLVAVTFLAGQTGLFLHSYPRSGFLHWEQVIAAAIELSVGLLLAFFLRMGSYPGEAAEDFSKWRDNVIQENGQFSNDKIETKMISDVIPNATLRVNALYKENRNKSGLLCWAHWTTLVAFLFNCIVLGSLAGITICFFQ